MSLIVMGSVNHDLTIDVAEFPGPGETILARGTQTATGGKSANQAVAGALAGVPVQIVARCGADPAGELARADLEEAGVDTTLLTPAEAQTGTALIHLRQDGENTITVIPGANTLLTSADCPAQALGDARWLLLSLEVPLSTVLESAARARSAGVKVALNLSPSPVQPVSLAEVDLVIVNDGEARTLLGASPDELQDPAGAAGLETLVVTHGPRGASVYTAGTPSPVTVPGVPVHAVDTTGCGDAFAGVLVARLSAGDSMLAALDWATAFAAEAATQPGAQSSYPRDFAPAGQS